MDTSSVCRELYHTSKKAVNAPIIIFFSTPPHIYPTPCLSALHRIHKTFNLTTTPKTPYNTPIHSLEALPSPRSPCFACIAPLACIPSLSDADAANATHLERASACPCLPIAISRGERGLRSVAVIVRIMQRDDGRLDMPRRQPSSMQA